MDRDLLRNVTAVIACLLLAISGVLAWRDFHRPELKVDFRFVTETESQGIRSKEYDITITNQKQSTIQIVSVSPQC